MDCKMSILVGGWPIWKAVPAAKYQLFRFCDLANRFILHSKSRSSVGQAKVGKGKLGWDDG
jgi:hypothetical protein